jgi:hypothetical protein
MGISLIITKEGGALDITHLTETVTWSGRKGSSARSLSAAILDDDGYKHGRSGIDVAKGTQCIFSYNGTELFRGLITSTAQGQKKRMEFTAYDNGISLSNNEDTFTYTNKTASEIFTDVCARFAIPTDEVAKTDYKIPELTKPSSKAFGVITDALGLEFKATGIRHYIKSEKGKLSLLTRRENILQWVIETGQNLTTYSLKRGIDKIITRIRLVSDEGKSLAEARNSDLESKIGIFQTVKKTDETFTSAQIKELAESMLTEQSTPEETLDIEALGNIEVMSGIGVFVIIPLLGLGRTFYVDDDTHTFKDQKHTMRLKLSRADDLKAEKKEETHKIGDIVNFKGGFHYVSSSASTPTGSKCGPGPAKLTLIAKGAKHPYHLINTDGTTRVYGWVDEGTF